MGSLRYLVGLMLVGWSVQQTPVDVEVDSGTLRGQRHDDGAGNVYDEFLGIPFAAPPIGNLRWEKPEPVEAWDGILEVTQFSIHCTHFFAPFYPILGIGEGAHGEDCLYLNVWVPEGVDEVSDLPVMVYYFGGGFVLGTGEMYPSQKLATEANVIVVNFNYRLSTLGWLSSGDDVLPGNFGMWDARAALQWVQRNIAQFGGDPDRVTIFGQSAGGCMVSHSVISPQFEGLFQRAIAISGVANTYFGLTRQPRGNLLMMSEVFGCETEDAQEIVDCLRPFDNDLLDFWGIIGDVMRGRMPSFIPTIDGEMIIGEPSELYAEGYGKDIDYITGNTHHDSAGIILMNPIAMRFLGDRFSVAATQESLSEFMELFFSFSTNGEELTDIVYDLYPDMISTDNLTRTLNTVEWSTDMWMRGPSFYEATQHGLNAGPDGGSTYHYEFQFRHTFLAGYPDWVDGSHVDDLYTVFGQPFMEQYRQIFLRLPWTAPDITAHNLWTSYLSNFAHTGDPNVGDKEVPVPWPEMVDRESGRLVVSDDPRVDQISNEDADLFYYWASEFKDLVERPEFNKEHYDAKTLIKKVVELKDVFPSIVSDERLLAMINQQIDYFIEKGISK
ncbi:hypothetical protein CAPTEDRAFT_204250 [Capitella teleta]|uniref:Carboxylic ester hydrolase n=1 Tax=Capitella teleta TaxID=283909 RepID=R7VGB9_CAPTE|nr:hypothetical protein CAPTEDRAFT_204250 [Capitella teleta]|eukprot:ELU17659.1 hypothetical protein CAPTEDRAFT_204250 [Capitella teleta]